MRAHPALTPTALVHLELVDERTRAPDRGRVTQTEAVQQWWAGLTETEQHAIARLRPQDALPQGLAIDLAMSGVAVPRTPHGPRTVPPAVSDLLGVLRTTAAS